MSVPIPQPPGIPLLGNLLDIDPKDNIASIGHLAEKYGEIMRLDFGAGSYRYFITSARLTHELCDEKRFVKGIFGALTEIRAGIGDGLFTAHYGEHNWGVAHRTLIPAFGPMGIRDMFDEMHDIATQLVAKWARLGPNAPINASDEYTRLTLDSIALCAMDKRFNSFYSNELHPFVTAMQDFLLESQHRTTRTRLQSFLNPGFARKFQQDIDTMKSVAKEVIEYRRANPVERKDLLNAMLFGKDPQTGERLTDENIMNNMITFLIAGHETTSGMLAFASYYLIKNPETWQKAQKEVDEVVGKGPVKYEHMSKLPYLEAVLREALRLNPSAPAFSIKQKPGIDQPFILGGDYTLPADAEMLIVLPQLHRDPVVYGSNVSDFNPERMYGENFTNLPPGAWKPFGNGERACIGRAFAWQEALLTLALILQNFNLRLHDPSYELKVKQTLTLKPDNFFMHATLREGVDPIQLEKRMYSGDVEQKTKPAKTAHVLENGKPMTILFGGNSGTCEGLAQSLASTAAGHGLKATVRPLDSATDSVLNKHPIVIISSSYEGNPPDNAKVFVEWLKGASGDRFKDAQVAVFGCGHSDWASTFQKIPRLLESELLRCGAKMIVERGETNVAKGTIFDDFDMWSDKLWPIIGVAGKDDDDTVTDGLDMKVSTTVRSSHLRQSVQDALVLKNEILTAPGVGEKRFMQFRLPTSMTYEAGDYLALLPINNVPTISRVLRRFHLPWDAHMTLSKGTHSTIPTERELPITVVLGAYVELNNPASRKNISTLVKYGGDESKITAMSTKSILEILEAFREVELPFSVYLAMLTPMRIRQYSIASSPLDDPTVVSIVYSVVDTEEHLGVATNYLRSLQEGATVQIAVRKSHASFHLPAEDTTPIIMVSAGTGLAPFRGFVQERAVKIAAGKSLGPAALFIGCRDPSTDKLFDKELAQWESQGAVKLFYAYSQHPDQTSGCKYAQDRLFHERKPMGEHFRNGAKVYICGSGRLGQGVAETAARIHVEDKAREGETVTLDEGLKWWQGLRNERYAVDVFD